MMLETTPPVAQEAQKRLQTSGYPNSWSRWHTGYNCVLTYVCGLVRLDLTRPDRFDSGVDVVLRRRAQREGSIPRTDTFDDIAQLVERQAVNLLVVGSSPSIVAISIYSLIYILFKTTSILSPIVLSFL